MLCMAEITKLNRLKIILAKENLTNKCIGQQLENYKVTVSRWTINKQLSIKQLFNLAKYLHAKVKDLLMNQEDMEQQQRRRNHANA